MPSPSKLPDLANAALEPRGGGRNKLLVRPTGFVEADMYDTAMEQANVLLRFPVCALAVLLWC